MLRVVPWLLALVVLAVLYNLLPLTWAPTPAEITWDGQLDGAPVRLRVEPTAEGERLVLSGAGQASQVTATWIPVTGQGVIFERVLQREGDDWRSGLLILDAATRWQVLLTADSAAGVGALVASDWVRGADGVLRPLGREPEGGARLIGLVNRYGPVSLIAAAVVIAGGAAWQVIRARQVRRVLDQG
ncbi:MAG TPA: hypothetical protein PLC98_19205 [Anaerolineales bacterium]|nr:hypothetical protein [Anaerolineales bacterium]